MKIIRDRNQLVKLINKEKRIGFVPTMGGFHPGHLSLIKKSISQCKKTVVSIFVNKQQFNKKLDFINYPRNLKKDISKIRKLKVDYLFLPTEKHIYPNGVNKNIKISNFKNKLCGKNRPGHFKGVANVIDNFVNILKPQKIYLGEKDMQQLKIIKHFIKSNYKKIKVVSCKTIREKSGLAYSSRNIMLTKEEKKIGSDIYKYLLKNKKKIINNYISLLKTKKEILLLGANKIDYVSKININKIFKPYKKKSNYKVFIAYYLRSVRLIDNI